MDWALWLLLAATIVNAMLVGASLNQVIKQLPARRRIGTVAISSTAKQPISGTVSSRTGRWGVGPLRSRSWLSSSC